MSVTVYLDKSEYDLLIGKPGGASDFLRKLFLRSEGLQVGDENRADNSGRSTSGGNLESGRVRSKARKTGKRDSVSGGVAVRSVSRMQELTAVAEPNNEVLDKPKSRLEEIFEIARSKK